MGQMLRRTVRVQPGGLIEIRAPELPEGATAEVVVQVESEAEETERNRRLAELRDVFRQTQALPDAASLTDEDIENEIKAVRRSK